MAFLRVTKFVHKMGYLIVNCGWKPLLHGKDEVWYNPVSRRCPTDSPKPITGSRSSSIQIIQTTRTTSWKAATRSKCLLHVHNQSTQKACIEKLFVLSTSTNDPCIPGLSRYWTIIDSFMAHFIPYRDEHLILNEKRRLMEFYVHTKILLCSMMVYPDRDT